MWNKNSTSTSHVNVFILTALTDRNMTLYVFHCSKEQYLRHRRSGRKTKQPFFIWIEGTVIGPQNRADRWGTPPLARLLTRQWFRHTGLKASLSFGFTGMSRVKQKKKLNCLLFLSAVTRKGFGERQMSPLWINAKSFKTCWCFWQHI